MSVPDFGNLKGDAGLEKLNSYLSSRSYITGYCATQDDVYTLQKLLGQPSPSKYPHAYRWYKHISSFCACEQKTWKQGEIKQTKEKQQKDDDDDIDLFG